MADGPARLPGAGAPITVPDEQLLAILHRHSMGEHILNILDEPNMPDWATFYRRVICEHDADEQLRTAWQRAQESWAMRYVAQVPKIADEDDEGIETTTTVGPKGSTTSTRRADRLGARRLKIDARTWYAERILEKLAARQRLSHFGGNGEPLVPVAILTVIDERKKE